MYPQCNQAYELTQSCIYLPTTFQTTHLSKPSINLIVIGCFSTLIRASIFRYHNLTLTVQICLFFTIGRQFAGDSGFQTFCQLRKTKAERIENKERETLTAYIICLCREQIPWEPEFTLLAVMRFIFMLYYISLNPCVAVSAVVCARIKPVLESVNDFWLNSSSWAVLSP